MNKPINRELTETELRSRDLVLGWTLALWALGLGTYLTLGGASRLTSKAYTVLMATLDNHYQYVGVALMIAGATMASGLLFRSRLITVIGALGCGLWCAGISWYMTIAALTVEGAGNINMFSSGLCAMFFFVWFLSYRRGQRATS